MSSPSTSAVAAPPPPGGRVGANGPVAALTFAADVANGLPVADLPPLIEPVGFEPTPALPPSRGQRPPRRSFLAPAATAALEPAATPPAVPQLIEPVAEPAAEPVSPPAARRWLARACALWPDNRRTQILAGGAVVVALGIMVGLAHVARLGPFAPVRHYPVSAAPNDPAGHLAYFQDGARAGDAEAELQLAIIYAKGDGVAQDYATAATWFRAAAQQGVPRAQYDLGVLDERGRGVKVDLAEAASWYKKAAEAGYPLAQYNLAVCYTRGQGLRQDLPEAALWYHRAAEQGVVQAMINLGTMYDKGEGVGASPADAYAWFLAAGRRSSPPAARRAEDIFNSLAQLDQIRAQALASDVAKSIHDPQPDGETAAGNPPDAKPAAQTH